MPGGSDGHYLKSSDEMAANNSRKLNELYFVHECYAIERNELSLKQIIMLQTGTNIACQLHCCKVFFFIKIQAHTFV